MSHKSKTIYTTGKRDGLAAIYILDYGDAVVASAEVDKITFLQMKGRLKQEYPALEFVQTFQRGCTDTIFARGEKDA